jgi:hypothetical protein
MPRATRKILSQVKSESSLTLHVGYAIEMLQKLIEARGSYIAAAMFKSLPKSDRKKYRSQLQELKNGCRILVDFMNE